MLENILSNLLRKIADELDSGQYKCDDEQIKYTIDQIAQLNNNSKMSKYQSFNYLHISRATFDNLIKEGKIPPGIKQQGFTELFWFKKDLDKYKETYKTKSYTKNHGIQKIDS